MVRPHKSASTTKGPLIAPTNTKLPIRNARPADLDGVVDVVLKAMPMDPQWNYRFQHRDKNPADHRYYTKLMINSFLNSSAGDWTVKVIEAPCLEDLEDVRIVSFSVWDTSYIRKRQQGALPGQGIIVPASRTAKNKKSPRRGDINLERATAFSTANSEARRKYFYSLNGPENTLVLRILGTHPDYQRRGYATALCNWGISKAKEDGVIIGLLASPMGYHLYTRLGFKYLAKQEVHVEGEDERVFLKVMLFTI